MYSRTFPSGGSQRTFSVLVVGSVTCRFLTKPSGSEHRRKQEVNLCGPVSYNPDTQGKHASVPEHLLTRLAGVRQTGPVSLGVDGDHGDGVAGVWEELLQDGLGGAL